ncbi:hypothetical protein [Bradyrhizobium oligotrophicum]
MRTRTLVRLIRDGSSSFEVRTWPARCSTSRVEKIANKILVAGCQ